MNDGYGGVLKGLMSFRKMDMCMGDYEIWAWLLAMGMKEGS